MLPLIFDGQEERKLGCLPRVAAVGSLFPVLETAVPLIPRSEWKPVSRKHLVWHIHDQDGLGSCNAEASTQVMELTRELCGLKKVPLSPGNLYGRINGGADRGSVLGDAIAELQAKGVCSTDTVSALEWHSRNWPAGWEKEAEKYKAEEFFDCPTFDHVASAIIHCFFVDYGIMVGGNFTKLDSDGWVVKQNGGGGHAMAGIGLACREVNGKTEWGVETVNSWGEQVWGGGIAIVPESYFRGEFNDAWALRSVTQSPDEPWEAGK